MPTYPPNPFKGLRPFKEEDHEKLFGRDRDLILITDRISSARTTLLFAGSGVGKTSFLNAKVIPELQKDYQVVWHNRWTGTDDEEFSASALIGKDRMRWWPPTILARDLRRKIDQILKREAGSKSDSRIEVIPKKEIDPFSAEVHNTIAQSLTRGSEPSKDRLPQLFSAFKARPDSQTSDSPTSDTSREEIESQTADKKWCILILDQFEEIFQYHAYEEHFKTFLKDLAELINQNYRIRIVFAMREEFLGELSVFDNLIPDLFGNYYRLKYPDQREAQNIISLTSKLSEINTDPARVKFLVDDLSTGNRYSRNPMTTKLLAPRRNSVPLPYLQIVCERLWEEQYKTDEESEDARASGDKGKAAVSTSYTNFLSSYRPNSDDGLHHDGDAERVLREFCLDKLGQPFLSEREQNLVAHAFDFLVTKQGAKMAYELSSLADHMKEQTLPLKQALEKLSCDDVRILRESRGPDRSYWFELYHDMYAVIVDDWRRSYQRIRESRARRKLIGRVALPIAVLFLIVAVPHWITNPWKYRSTLLKYRSDIEKTRDSKDSDKQLPGAEAAVAYTNFRNTLGYGRIADSLWADILDSRAVIYGRQGHRDEALLCLLKAATLRLRESTARADLAKAEALLGDDFPSLRTTYAREATYEDVSFDRKTVLTMNSDHEVALWNAESGENLATLCSDCIQTMFSADGKAVATLRRKTQTLTPKPSQSAQPTETANAAGQASRAKTRSALSQNAADPSKVSDSQSPGTTDTPDPATLSRRKRISVKPPPTRFEIQIWDVASAQVTDNALTVDVEKGAPSGGKSSGSTADANVPILRALGGDSSGYVIVAKTGKSFVIGNSRKGSLIKSALSISDDFEPQVNLSPDGHYLLIDSSDKVALWNIRERLTPEKRIDHLSSSFFANGGTHAFSADGRSFIALHDDNKVRLWQLGSNEAPKIVPSEKMNVGQIVFSDDGRQFMVVEERSAASKVMVFDSLTFETVYPAVTLTGEVSHIDFRSALKIFLTSRDVGRNTFYEKWDLPTGKLVGRFVRTGGGERAPSFSENLLNAAGDSVFAISPAGARLWNLQPAVATGNLLRADSEIAGRTMSVDGKILLTTILPDKMQVWSLESAKPLSPPQDSNRYGFGNTLSPSGAYVATFVRSLLDVRKTTDPSSLVSMSFPEIIQTVAFSSDDEFLGVATAKAIYVSKPTSSSPFLTFPVDTRVSSLRISPDHKYVVATFYDSSDIVSEPDAAPKRKPSSFKWVRVWTLPAGTEITLNEDLSKLTTTSVGSGSNMLTLARNGTDSIVRVWDLSNGRKLGVLAHNDQLNSATISPDGNWALTADTNGLLRLWDIHALPQEKELKPVGELKLSSGVLSSLFTDDHSLLIRKEPWIHRFSFDQNGFHDLGSIIPGRFDALRPTSPDGGNLRLARQFEDNSLEILNISFDGDTNLPHLKGRPDAILSAWESALGLSINQLGQIISTKD
jgi:WD40 repeat protein